MQYWSQAFPRLPSYNRFIEIMPRVISYLVLFSQTYSGKKTGIYYIDSSCLPVCHLKRSNRNKTFKNIAEYGRTSVGWFSTSTSGRKEKQVFERMERAREIVRFGLR